MNRLAASMSYFRRSSRVAMLAIACFLCGQQSAWPQTAAPGADPASLEKAAEPTGPENPATAAELKRKMGTVSIATVLLVGICVVGFSLMWMTVVWGRRVRRLARQQRRGPTVVDELWYLKPKKPTVDPARDDARNETP